MLLRGNFDKYQDGTIISIPNFGSKSNIIENFNKFLELSFGLSFAYERLVTIQLSVVGILPVVANR